MQHAGQQFQSFLQDEDLIEEIRQRAAAGKLPLAQKLGIAPELIERALTRARFPRAPLRGLEGAARPRAPPPPSGGSAALEAIVLEQGRPSLVVQNGTFLIPDSRVWRTVLQRTRGNIEQAIARVGRVELHNHMTYQWVGTGWLVAENIVMTNRHVAEEFAIGRGAGFAFATNLLGNQIEASIDFREEYEIDLAIEVSVEKILHIAGKNEPDIALLRIASDKALPSPIALADKEVEQRQTIGVIGYPAFDSRNGLDAMRRYFGDIFDVKRFAPGKVSFPTPDEHYFIHDCTTLGGNSGSKVIDIESGKVVGLHFSGAFLSGNFAVKVSAIKDALRNISTTIAVKVPKLVQEEALADGRHKPEFFADRDGYVSGFLGPDVPLPKLGRWAKDAVAVKGKGKKKQYELKYRHFSVTHSASRKLPIFTGVNIDGKESRRAFRRTDKWFIDLRISEDLQLGNEIYRSNELDRGHMVRRLDPVWGNKEHAAQANDDTFHYVNAAPQHKDLNQKEWSNLEGYILDSTMAKDLKVSVFTGPVMRDTDQDYRGLVKLPQEFWKIAVLVNADNNELSSAGYVLSQGEMLKDISEAAFVFGEFRTYQILVAKIEEETGLNFGKLRDRDSLVRQREEGISLPRALMIRGPQDLVL
ncbi:DNA/RNA non-specific endonuclease [Bradyrhizobium sp. CSS354]|uniref:DNA/RNA non-specific endonuclease n=1 Tax=Bradyrhizobium sp. CSS354 TaxID=2699172 RepID=UPI0023AF5198|nr:DNA/RNA non-specific endonuclease [Bradyrhizobium sp. CSS354]MDE5461342.1 protease [Bradyrhizobium sp. CSS354]